MTVRIDGFDWVDELVEKIRVKHGVEPDEVESAIANTDPSPYTRRIADRYICLAQTESGGSYLFIVFCMPRRYIARVISARRMTAAEKAAYRKRIGGA